MRLVPGLLAASLATAFAASAAPPASASEASVSEASVSEAPAPITYTITNADGIVVTRPGVLLTQAVAPEAAAGETIPEFTLKGGVVGSVVASGQVLPPSPVPAEKAGRPDPPPARIRLGAHPVPQPFSTLISKPPVVADESIASAELLAWRDHLEGKQERRIERNAEIGGMAAMGVRLGGPSQAGSIEGITEAQLESLEGWNEDGALVIAVVAGSPAEQAGLLPGDVIVQYGGIWIDTMQLLVRVASRTQVDREQEIWILRAGEIERLWLTPADRRELESR